MFGPCQLSNRAPFFPRAAERHAERAYYLGHAPRAVAEGARHLPTGSSAYTISLPYRPFALASTFPSFDTITLNP